MNIKLNYSQKVLVLVVFLLIVVTILVAVFSNLLFGKIIDINDKVRQINISSQERERELNLKDFIASSEASRTKLVNYFVGSSTVDTVAFTKYLESLAASLGVTQTKSLNYEAVNSLESSATVSAIRFKFNITGRFTNVYNFLQAIENLPKIMRLNSVALNLDSATTTGKIWSASLDFSVAKLKK